METDTNQTLRIKTHQHHVFSTISIRQRPEYNTTQHHSTKINRRDERSNVSKSIQISYEPRNIHIFE